MFCILVEMSHTSVDTIITDIQSRGHRMTKTRRAILEILSDTQLPIDAIQLSTLLLKKGLSVHKTTIYRELTFLVQENVVHEIQFGVDKTFFEIIQEGTHGHHHHIRCIQCNVIQEVRIPNELATATKHIEEQTQFHVIDHSLEFIGLCPQCSKAQHVKT